jgi:ATP-binding cassette subfamily B protein
MVAVVGMAALPVALAVVVGRLVGLVAEAVDGGSGTVRTRDMLVAGAITVALLAVQHMGTPLLRALGRALGRRVDRDLRALVMEAALAPKGIGHLENPRVVARISDAKEAGRGEVTAEEAVAALAAAASRTVAAVGATVILAAYRWWLAATLLVVHVAMASALAADLRGTVQALWRESRGLRRTSGLRESATSAAISHQLRVFGRARSLWTRYTGQWAAAMDAFEQERGNRVWLPPGAAVAMAAAQGATFTLLGRSAATGEIGPGQLVTFAMSAFVVAGLSRIGLDDADIGLGTVPVPAAVELKRFMPDERFDLGGIRRVEGLPRTGIRFEQVWFGYPGSPEQVLRGLDLEIPAGGSVAIVGEGGAGKSTIVKLLARLYDPSGGRVLVDGIDLADLDPGAWRSRLAVAFQDFTRYELSLAENVTFGAVEQSNDRSALELAAGRARLDDLVERLPEGWHSQLSTGSPGGVDLSEGEWQRVGIARAFFAAACGAPVVVLDEPAGVLDAVAEDAFYDRFLQLGSGVTTVLVSQRLSTVRRAQRIVLVEAGRVVEEGDHDSLMTAGGAYARLFERQAASSRYRVAPVVSASDSRAPRLFIGTGGYARLFRPRGARRPSGQADWRVRL